MQNAIVTDADEQQQPPFPATSPATSGTPADLDHALAAAAAAAMLAGELDIAAEIVALQKRRRSQT